jgi:transcriptional antiterminator NusG
MSTEPDKKEENLSPEDVATSDDGLKWYFLQVQAGQEKSVQKTLKDRIKDHDAEIQAYFGEILVPTEEVVEMKAGQKRKSERKFFPGYLLVKMLVNEKTWYLVREVPKVKGFVGGTSRTQTQCFFIDQHFYQ